MKKSSLLQNSKFNQENNLNLDRPMVFSSDDEELEYVNNYFNNKQNNGQDNQETLLLSSEDKSINPAHPKYKPITITRKERLVLLQSIRYNDNYVMPFVADDKTIESLYKKRFIEKNDDEKLFKVKKNVCLLFEIEGPDVFDEIVS